MQMMTSTRPTGLQQLHVRLDREPAAVSEARSQVRTAVRAWQTPVDPDIAILLTSDLVTSALAQGRGGTVTLAIRCSRGQLRIDLYDTSGSGSRETGRGIGVGVEHGLVLVAALSTDWGSFRTPAGQVTYFTLAFDSDTNQKR
jgi:hypothetical protein